MSKIIHNHPTWVWFKRKTHIINTFSHEYADLDRQMQDVMAFMAHEGDIREHVYDPGDETQNILLSQRIYSALPNFIEALGNLGWVETEPPKVDQEEKKDFYDALLKGGTLQ